MAYYDQLSKDRTKKRERDDIDRLTDRTLRKFVRKQKKKKKEPAVLEKKYSIYGSNPYAITANKFLGNFSFYLLNKYPEFFYQLIEDLKVSNIKIYSKSYISVLLFTTLISFPLILLVALFFLFWPLAILVAFIGMVLTFLSLYYYPRSLVNDRKKKIKFELVFAIVHMSAIAESGAKPISMFRLLLESEDYKYLSVELKEILNYTNLFGYSLSTALRAVAETTHSNELKELLNGITSTIESGGDLKSYLKDKADDTLEQYRIDQRKYSAKLATYSDLYIGILLAAPLLFLITLRILEKITPDLGGISISAIAAIGTFVAIPIINIMFIIFLNLSKSEF